MRLRGICSIDDCSRPHKAKSYCELHYKRFKATGDPNMLKRAMSKPHGMVRTRTWYSWVGMIERTTSKSYKQYKDYAGRGIDTCDRWRGAEGFLNFYADMGERPEGMTLDRIDNDKGYSPDNCRWATWHDQRINQRRMHHV